MYHEVSRTQQKLDDNVALEKTGSHVTSCFNYGHCGFNEFETKKVLKETVLVQMVCVCLGNSGVLHACCRSVAALSRDLSGSLTPAPCAM